MRYAARSSLLLAVGALALGAATGCTDITSNGASAEGTYVLQTIDGVSVPTGTTQNGVAVTVQSEVYTLNADQSYTRQESLSITNGSQTQTSTENESGSWSQNNNAVQFIPTVSSTGSYTNYTGALSGGGVLSGGLTLTLSQTGHVRVYKQP
jgi:hypothetical protein